MPSDTFLNLPPAKRENFLREALLEFALHDYGKASVSRIVKQLGIAKGSVYQYFKNKEDLFFYLIELCSKRKAEVMQRVLSEPRDDFFQWFSRLFLAGMNFDMRYPLHSGFLYNFALQRNNPLFAGFFAQHEQFALDFYGGIIARQQQKGTVRADLNVPMFSRIFSDMSWQFLQYIMDKYKIDFRKNIKSGKPIYSLPPEKMNKEVQDLIKLVRRGIGS